MIDGGIVAGYLSLAIAKAAGRFVDRRLDRGLDDLAGRIQTKFGPQPATDLARKPGRGAQQHVASAIEAAARRDPQFERDLRQIVGQLDYLGGRNAITTNIQGPYLHHQGRGDIAAYGGNIYKPYVNAYPGDASHSPIWVKALVVIGTLVGFSGFGIIIFGILTVPGGMEGGSDIPNLGLGMGVFFSGVAILGIGKTIAEVTKHR